MANQYAVTSTIRNAILGAAGLLAVGVGAGTVAAGDDSRITGAVQASTLTTNGDLLTRAAGVPARLGVGTEAQVLTVTSGVPAWAAPASTAPLRVGLASLSTTVGPGGTNGPPGGKGWTFAVAIYAATVGGGAIRSLWSNSNGSTRGWGFVLTTTDVPQFTALGSGTSPTLGSALTVGARKIAFSLAADGLTYGYAVDGAGSAGVSIDASAALPADPADAHEVGNWLNGFYPASGVEVFHLVAIEAPASEAQLEAMTATPSDLRLAVPSALAADVDMDLNVSDVPGHLLMAGWTTVCRGAGQRVLVTAGTPTVAVR